MSKPRLYVCAGMHRSGSTWLYNVVRLALMGLGEYVYATTAEPVGMYDPEYPVKQHVVKTHTFRQDLVKNATRVFTSRRDLRDVAASMVRLGNIENEVLPVLKFLHWELRLYLQWSSFSKYESVYEDMVQDKLLAVRSLLYKLGMALNMEANSNEIHAQVQALRAPPKEAKMYDPTTLLTPGHFTDGRVGSYKDTLSPEVVRAIEEEFGDWLQEKGYEVG